MSATAALAAAIVTVPFPAVAAVAGHVYVATTHGVERFALTNGVPAKQPDLTYTGVGGPLAVDATNHLYAVVPSLKGQISIVEFEPATTKPMRTIDMISRPDGAQAEASALAVDAAGYLYVALAFDQFGQSLAHCAWQISVFAPAARGYATPVQCLAAASPFSMAIDPSGDLNVTSSQIAGDAVFAIASPATKPVIVRRVYGSAFSQPDALACDSAGLLYVLNANFVHGRENSYVSVFAPGPDGAAVPMRTILPQMVRGWNGALAVDDKYLYIATGYTQMAVYDKTVAGRTKPLAALTLAGQDIMEIAIGP